MIRIEKSPEYDGHEIISRIQDPITGLVGFIAIHNTNLGPAVGGTRYWYYKNEEEAIRDALRLSRAMTYKCALANVPFGGGKAVLMAPKDQESRVKLKNKLYLAAYARRLAMFEDHFFTGEDVGMLQSDIEELSMVSKSIIGLPSIGGLPSPFAAQSVFESMKAALKIVYGSEEFGGKTIAIKGLGNVGFDLAKLLTEVGASVIGSDISKEKTDRVQKLLPGVKIVSFQTIHKQDVDIYSPCALGGDITAKCIKELSCKIVCGSANNQLATPLDGQRLLNRSIVYVPDYIANAGGLITVVDELHNGGYDRNRVEKNVAQIKNTVMNILTTAQAKKLSPGVVADQLAENRFGIR